MCYHRDHVLFTRTRGSEMPKTYARNAVRKSGEDEDDDFGFVRPMTTRGVAWFSFSYSARMLQKRAEEVTPEVTILWSKAEVSKVRHKNCDC